MPPISLFDLESVRSRNRRRGEHFKGSATRPRNLFRRMTGYDRVMIYRFDDEGHGEVFSETRKPELEAFLGNRYPASDIPQIARRLYSAIACGFSRMCEYTPAAARFRGCSPLVGAGIWTCRYASCAACRRSIFNISRTWASARHLVVSLMVRGKLWGLVSCHHYSPRVLNFEMRSVCEFLAEVDRDSDRSAGKLWKGQGELAARRLEQRMTEWIARDGDWRGALFDRSRPLLLPLGATGRGASVRRRDPDDRETCRRPTTSAILRAGCDRCIKDGCFRDRKPRRAGARLRSARRRRQRTHGRGHLEPRR